MVDTSATPTERPAFAPGTVVPDRDRLWCVNAPDGDIATVLRQYPDSEFPHLTRSTIPLLAYWREPARRITEIL
jgi:hypothetical protein